MDKIIKVDLAEALALAEAARAMLAALKRFKAWNDKDQGSGALEDALNAAAKAIAQAKAAGIRAED